MTGTWAWGAAAEAAGSGKGTPWAACPEAQTPEGRVSLSPLPWWDTATVGRGSVSTSCWGINVLATADTVLELRT